MDPQLEEDAASCEVSDSGEGEDKEEPEEQELLPQQQAQDMF